jgi:hypothetical protein
MPNGGPVFVKPGAAGKADVTMDGVRMEGKVFAVSVQDRSMVTIRNSVAASNSSGPCPCRRSPGRWRRRQRRAWTRY